MYASLLIIIFIQNVFGKGVHQTICPSHVHFSNMKELEYSNITPPLITPKKDELSLMTKLEKKIKPTMPYINLMENVINDDTLTFKTGENFEWNSEEDTLVPDFLYQSFIIARELAPHSKIGYSESNIVSNENKFFFVKQSIEHMISFMEPILPDFMGFIIHDDDIDLNTLSARMVNLKTLHIKSHIIYKGPGTLIKTLETFCKDHPSCEHFEYQSYIEYSGEKEQFTIELTGIPMNTENIQIVCKGNEYNIAFHRVLHINVFDLPMACHDTNIYEFYIQYNQCKRKYSIQLDNVNVESDLHIENQPDIDIDVYVKDAPFCVHDEKDNYKYTADIRVDLKESNLKWAFSNEKSTCVSNYICTSKPCLANDDDTVTVTSKKTYIENTNALQQTFSVDIYSYDEIMGVKYLFSKSVVNDVFIKCKDMSFQDDIVEVKADAVLNVWLMSGTVAPKTLKKSDTISISLSMVNKYDAINLNIEEISWSLIGGDNVLSDTYYIDSHCERCKQCILYGKDMGKHSDVVTGISMQNFIDELYKHDKYFQTNDLTLTFDVEATLSFCNSKRRRLQSEYHMMHKHIKKSSSFHIDLGHKKKLSHTITPTNNQDRITLTISGGTNILITVLFVLFVAFACLCYSIHLYMPSYERRRREEEEFNFKSLD